MVKRQTNIIIAELFTLIENCDYRALKDEMLRDRLVVGIKDSALSEKNAVRSSTYPGKSYESYLAT